MTLASKWWARERPKSNLTNPPVVKIHRPETEGGLWLSRSPELVILRRAFRGILCPGETLRGIFVPL